MPRISRQATARIAAKYGSKTIVKRCQEKKIEIRGIINKMPLQIETF